MNDTENTTRPIDTLIRRLNALGYNVRFDEVAKAVRSKEINFTVDDSTINGATEYIINEIVEFISLKMDSREVRHDDSTNADEQ